MGVAFKPIADQLIVTDVRRDFRERGLQSVPQGRAAVNDVVPARLEKAVLQRLTGNAQVLFDASGPSSRIGVTNHDAIDIHHHHGWFHQTCNPSHPEKKLFCWFAIRPQGTRNEVRLQVGVAVIGEERAILSTLSNRPQNPLLTRDGALSAPWP